jgi:hypothetical protein
VAFAYFRERRKEKKRDRDRDRDRSPPPSSTTYQLSLENHVFLDYCAAFYSFSCPCSAASFVECVLALSFIYVISCDFMSVGIGIVMITNGAKEVEVEVEVDWTFELLTDRIDLASFLCFS